MKGTIRQSNAWLHTWAGLLLGWLMFAIFVTGTTAFFRQEITHWMQPELHAAGTSPTSAQRGAETLRRLVPDATSWTISLPSERTPTLRVSWKAAGGERGETRGSGQGRNDGPNDARSDGHRAKGDGASAPQAHRSARRARDGATKEKHTQSPQVAAPVPLAPERIEAEAAVAKAAGGGGRRRQPTLTLDPASGEVLRPRDTAGGEFLYHFHYQLHALPREVGRWIVGIATFAMFIAIISGVITHKKIFKDFFTFRARKGQRSWLDAHNATAVLALPFHFMITFSGLLLLAGTLLPWGAQTLFRGDARAAAQQREKAEERAMDARRDALAAAGERPPLPIADLVLLGEDLWGQPVGRITIDRPDQPGATVTLTPERNDSLLLRAGGGPGRSLTLDAATGEVIERVDSEAKNGVEAIDRVFVGLHLARFAPWELRWMFFLSGVLGTIMVGTGLALWAVKRAEKRRGAAMTFGQALVEHLNLAVLAGLPLAIAAFFWANRLIPSEIPRRAGLEVSAFFAVWALCLVHPALRKFATAWREQLFAGGTLFALLPVLNALTGGDALPHAVLSGNWIVAAFDIVALLTGAALIEIGRRVGRPRAQTGRPRRTTIDPLLQPAE